MALRDLWGDGFIHGHQEICFDDRPCEGLQVHQTYLDAQDRSQPVLIWSGDSFSSDAYTTVQLRLLDSDSPVRESNMTFDRAIVTEVLPVSYVISDFNSTFQYTDLFEFIANGFTRCRVDCTRSIMSISIPSRMVPNRSLGRAFPFNRNHTSGRVIKVLCRAGRTAPKVNLSPSIDKFCESDSVCFLVFHSLC